MIGDNTRAQAADCKHNASGPTGGHGRPKKKASPQDDTIKVIVRFKGHEQLAEGEQHRWAFNRAGNEVQTPQDDRDRTSHLSQ